MASFTRLASSPEEADTNRHRSPRYAGEDTTPTQRREILGWYAYGIAAEVFAVCGVGMYFTPPIMPVVHQLKLARLVPTPHPGAVGS
jgi:hypothetical protein